MSLILFCSLTSNATHTQYHFFFAATPPARLTHNIFFVASPPARLTHNIISLLQPHLQRDSHTISFLRPHLQRESRTLSFSFAASPPARITLIIISLLQLPLQRGSRTLSFLYCSLTSSEVDAVQRDAPGGSEEGTRLNVLKVTGHTVLARGRRHSPSEQGERVVDALALTQATCLQVVRVLWVARLDTKRKMGTEVKF